MRRIAIRKRVSFICLMIGLPFIFMAANTDPRSSTALLPSPAGSSSSPRRLEILFLGHSSKHHDSEKLAEILEKEYFKSGINISYTTDPNDLNTPNLKLYDGLILYANYDTISVSQEQALLEFVRGGKGFIPIHCASYCFRNSPEVVEMIGGQFKSHGVDSFSMSILEPNHPVMKNIKPFVTKDETYTHDKLSPAIEVLAERVEGSHHEPYTWVRPYGQGRVFYTAFGHDENTFLNQGFLDLVKNGILWAVGDKASRDLAAYPIADPKYFEAAVPNYEKRNPPPKAQESLDPRGSMSLMQVPAGFSLKLFAAEPDIINPIYMNWDEKGRLWVIETVDYPNEIKKDDIGDDRIKILEDTDGDGKADKVTIFADGLNIPTSFVFANGGIIVSQAPSFIFLKDTDGDDRADVRQTLLTGWGKSDTHAQASNLRYGLDNKIWGVVGYSGYYNGKKGKDSLGFNQGVYRFDRDGKNLELLSRTSNNTWGLGFSEEFDAFISTANNDHSNFLGIPKRYLARAGIKEPGVEEIGDHYAIHPATKNLRQVDVQGGFTAAAGHSLYTARSFPREYWNRVAFVTEPTGRLVHRNILQQSGSGFREEGDGWNMLVSADEWAAPIQAETGPDGALWVADWYDFIIQHNPTPSPERGGYEAKNGEGNAYINPLRDHERGRIYRIVYNGNDRINTLRLDRNDTEGLLRALSGDNMFWRTTAQRLLVEKNDLSVLPALYRIAGDQSLDGAGINAPAIHALWTLHGLHALDGTNQQALNAAVRALVHPCAGVRKAAIQVLPKTPATLLAMEKAGVFADKDGRVRLAAVLAILDMKPSARTNADLAGMSKKGENKEDKRIMQALAIADKLNGDSGFGKKLTGDRPGVPSVPGAALSPAGSGGKTSEGAKIDRTIILKVLKDSMKYDRSIITVKAGSTLHLIFQNPDFMQHNLVLLRPGTREKVGAEADKMARDPAGLKMNYVPAMPEVVQSVPLINPGGKFVLTFKVPAVPGDYPYICTFPGHWRIMNGVMRVVK